MTNPLPDTGRFWCDVGMGTLLALPPQDVASVGRHTIVFEHHLTDHPLFTEDAIASLLDTYPAEKLFALTMGSDPTRWEDNERVQHSGVSGHDLLTAVRAGRMWLNVTNVDAVDPRFRELTTQIYEELGETLPEYRGIESHCTLLVSSPRAMVYYHVDGPPSFLWHLKGRKQAWVYPALDTDLLPRPLLEDVFAGVRHEYVPYQHRFDDHAEMFTLEPGQVISWPQNAPHRITNLDTFNISFVTDHYTATARRRARVYTANRFFRTKAHVPTRLLHQREAGPVASVKVAAHRAARRLGVDNTRTNKGYRPITQRVDPKSPTGLSPVSS